MLHVKDSGQITVIDNKIMDESQLELGYNHLPLKNLSNAALNKENDDNSLNAKVYFNFIIYFIE